MKAEKTAEPKLAKKKSRRLAEIIGVVAVLGGVFVAVSVFSYSKWDRSFFTYSRTAPKNIGGPVGAHVADLVMSVIGLSGYLIPLFLVLYGIRKILGKEGNPVHVLGAAMFLPALSALAQMIRVPNPLNIEPPGGFAGLALSQFLTRYLSTVGAFIAITMLILISVILMSPVSVFSLMRRKKRSPVTVPEETPGEPEFPVIAREEERREIPVVPMGKVVEHPGGGDGEATVTDDAPEQAGSYSLPPLSFLQPAREGSGPSKEELMTSASLIEKKMADFGVSGRIKQAYPGPVVTMYEYEPAPGVKINRVVSLADDLALALRAQSIRIYPMAGKAAIGVEVPNQERATVTIHDIIGSDNFQRGSSFLTLCLGKDIFGNPVVTDLGKMPHLLVAGATGSGKSVSINTMIVSILYKASPADVKMLMIDPKLLELSAYAEIPHLISPVITGPKEASEALKKMVYEMERRYRLLAEKGARNIEGFNRHAAQEERLPYIVVFIDELADLMFTAPSDVENAIARLAQMARASGIHLILATQRPSVDVITGLIKANFPARISFRVTSKIDSRTILDAQGAEQLLGMGDMLFMLPGARITRIHGAYISDEEVRAITDFVKSQGKPDYAPFEQITLAAAEEKGVSEPAERDEMYQRVLDLAESAGEISISAIQRRLKIGFNRAARIMELLEEDGLVGPPRGAGKPRDFLGRR